MAALVLAVVSAACGSTVQGTRSVAAGGSELRVEDPVVATSTPSVDGDTQADAVDATDGAAVAPGAGPAGGDSGDTGGQTPATATPPSDGQPAPTTPQPDAPGGPTGPIKVGFFSIDYAAAASQVGASDDSDDGTYSSGVQYGAKVWVDIMNAGGGLAGREIQPSYYVMDATTPDWSTEYQAACSYFTEDEKVDVVVSEQGPTIAPCLLEHGIVEVNNAHWAAADLELLRSRPNAFYVNSLSVDRQVAAVIDQMVATGWLTPQDHVGVLLAGCPYYERVYADVVEPRAARHGFDVESYVAYNCPVGFANVADFARGSQSAALRFRANGVTKVLYLSPVENLINTLFAQNAEDQGWRPGYLLSTNALVDEAKGNIPPGQRPNMKGAGWMPVRDLPKGTATPTPARQRCAQTAEAAGQTPPDHSVPGDYLTFYAACDAMMFLDVGLSESHGSPTLADLGPALERVGSSVQASMTHGALRFGADRHDGVVATAPFSWSDSCECVRYDAQPSESGL